MFKLISPMLKLFPILLISSMLVSCAAKTSESDLLLLQKDVEAIHQRALEMQKQVEQMCGLMKKMNNQTKEQGEQIAETKENYKKLANELEGLNNKLDSIGEVRK